MKNLSLLGLISFGILALFSVSNYGATLANRCFFQMNWFFCNADVSSNQKITGLMIAVFSFVGLIASTYFYFNKISFNWKFVAVSTFLAFLIVPFGSADVSYYFSAGKALNNNVNVYAEEWRRVSLFQPGTPDVLIRGFQYGPISAKVFKELYKLSLDKIIVFTFYFKFLNALVLFICACLIFKILGNPTVDSVPVLWVLQPLILFEWISNVHFDGWWLLFVLFAIFLAIKDKWWLVFPLLIISVWIKYIPIILLPFFVLWFWQTLNKANWKKWSLSTLVALILSGLITVWSWRGLWAGKGVFSSLILQSKWAVMSIFSSAYYPLKPLAQIIFGADAHWWLTRFVHALLFGLFLYFLVPLFVQIWKIFLKRSTWTPLNYLKAVFVFFSIYILVWQKSIWPWYLIWPATFGLLVMQNDSSIYLKKAVRWMFFSPLIFYPVWYVNQVITGKDAAGDLWFSHVIVFSVAAYPLYLFYKWRKENYGLVLNQAE